MVLPDFPEPPPFVAPTRREEVTGEPEPPASHTDAQHEDLDWIGSAQQGGGHVPGDFEWTTNPKEDQDRLSTEVVWS
jgi:hypothetical protein